MATRIPIAALPGKSSDVAIIDMAEKSPSTTDHVLKLYYLAPESVRPEPPDRPDHREHHPLFQPEHGNKPMAFHHRLQLVEVGQALHVDHLRNILEVGRTEDLRRNVTTNSIGPLVRLAK